MRGIEKLHPELQPIVHQLVADCKKAGFPIAITETLRTKTQQDALYAQGRPECGGNKKDKIVTNCRGATYSSPHQWGVGVDFCRADGKGIYLDNDEDKDGVTFFAEVGAIAKQLGLVWGGDFRSMKDSPHLQLPKYLPNNVTTMLKAKYGTPEKFMATWKTAQPSDTTTPTKTMAQLQPVLRKGNTGDAVSKLQTLLNQKGYAVAVDGGFGDSTHRMVKLFQKTKGLEDDGIVGEKTWGALGV